MADLNRLRANPREAVTMYQQGSGVMAKLSVDELVDVFKDMTVGEVSTFVKRFEEAFGVSANASVVVPLVPVEPVEVVEEQTEFDVVLEAAGDKKIGVIKAVRELVRGLGLKEAKDLVDGAPRAVLRQVDKQDAQAARDKLIAAGAAVTVR